MGLFKKISIRLVLITIIVVVSNVVYKYVFYPSDVLENGLLTTKLEKGIQNSDILYFSASPNRAYPVEDKDRRSIGKILDDNLQNHTVTAIDTGAIHAGVYRKLISLIPNNNSVKYIVVNMNYRSFGIEWVMSSLENSIEKQSVFYNKRPLIINRFLQGLNYYGAVSKKERQQIILNYWKTQPLPFNPPKNTVENWCNVEKWGGRTHPKRNLADHYIKNYAFVLDENNQRVLDFDEIVDICQSKNIKLVFNILGENLENAEQLVDSELTDLMVKNKNWLINRYLNKNVIMVDNFGEIADSCFYERDFPTEHYSFAGRETIAKNIAKEIAKFESKK